MWERWETWELPKDVKINGNRYGINSDFRNALKIIKIMNADDLLEVEKAQLVYKKFFKEPDKVLDCDKEDVPEIIQYFMNGNKENETDKKKPILYDWSKDFNLIIAPVNRVAGEELLLKKYVHWWTFLRYFMEIGECTFSTYISIREKKATNKKLDKWEEKIWRENKDIRIEKKHDMETAQLINRILGR